jgi:tetratricopeptide (TPR) repeat protein
MSKEVAMKHTLTILLAISLAGASLTAQQATATPNDGALFLDKAELLRRIDLYESAASRAEASHASDADKIRIYTSLGTAYLRAAMYLKSEDTMRRAISLLRDGSRLDLAEEIGQLAILHVAMGNVKQAEKDQLEALRIREAVGDPIGTALTWNDLADLYVRQRQFVKGLDYAQRAMAVLADDPQVHATDRVAVRETLAFALCGAHQCAQAIPLLRDALELAKTDIGAGSLAVGVASYMMGYTFWKNGQLDEAVDWMQRGTGRMKTDWGWGSVIYVNAMQQYAKLLRQRGQMESAAVAEREVRQMTAAVDARSFAGRP